MTTALFLGRFQPVPHKGHVQVIREILSEYDQVIIGLGSAQYASTFENLLPVEKRTEVFEALFLDSGYSQDRYRIKAIPDIHDNDAYVAHVETIVSHFDTVFSGNELVQRLFREAGYDVRTITLHGNWSGTRVREMMLAGDTAYRDALPETSLRFVDEWDIVSQLRAART